MVIDGKMIAADVLAQLKAFPRPEGFFGAALVGDDPASLNFLKQKERAARELGIDFRLYNLRVDMTTDELRAEIGRLAEPRVCGAFIVQLPLPDGVNRHYALNAIPKAKDVDCLSEPALGAFYTGRGRIAPPSVATVEEILKTELKEDLRNLKAVVVGAGFLIGKPVGFWLQNRVGELVVLDATVRDVHSKLSDADIVVCGTGAAHLFGAEHLKTGALVIDFGFSRGADGKMTGDFDPAGAEEKGIRYSQAPSGPGRIVTAKLYENFYALRDASH